MLLLYQNAKISFLISSTEFCPPNTKNFNVLKKSISIHLLRNYLNNLCKLNQISMLDFGSLDRSNYSSENSSVNQLLFRYCSYSWFDRIDLLLLLRIWWLSLDLVLSIFFLILCSDLPKSLWFLLIFSGDVNLFFLLINLHIWSY